jgi:hypothetical protein
MGVLHYKKTCIYAVVAKNNLLYIAINKFERDR